MSEANPYAAPGTDATLLAGGGTNLGEPMPWDIGSALSAGWETFKQHWAVVLGTLVIGYVISIVPAVLNAVLARAGFPMLGMVLTQVLSMLVSAFIGIGWSRIWLDAVRGRAPQFERLFSGGDRFVSAVGAQLLLVLVILAALVALVVPAFIAAFGLGLSLMFVADTNLGAVDCLKASWRATSGHKLAIAGFWLVSIGVMLVSLIPCGLGLIVSGPVLVLSWAWIYTRLTGTPNAA